MAYEKKASSEVIEKILSKGVRDMPQNPGAQGYTERQIRGFYYLPEQQILELIKLIENEIAKNFDDIDKNKIDFKNIVDNLLSYSQDKPLSAYQGKVLNDLIKDYKKSAQHKLEINENKDTYIYEFLLKSGDGEILSKIEIDLPIESSVINIEFNEETKKLDFTLRNGVKTSVPVGDVIRGLATPTEEEIKKIFWG